MSDSKGMNFPGNNTSKQFPRQATRPVGLSAFSSRASANFGKHSVLDRTRLAGRYDFSMEFSPQDFRAMMIRAAIASGNADRSGNRYSTTAAGPTSGWPKITGQCSLGGVR